ncbi:hypothetical protein OUZ56_016783 [Daphnia magna]|uniref:Fucosyltransferase n=1 Tax=Daphnia magna TaxID=35525 RepID=A0ABR0ARJ1_9CRUS|nr:hypothetical protein OUZ56_016783 [Daphnia magna]
MMPASSYGRVKCINNSLYTIPIQFELPASEWLSEQCGLAWIATNCKTDNRRESMIYSLSLFIPVDIYGLCGSDSHRCANRVDCDLMLIVITIST